MEAVTIHSQSQVFIQVNVIHTKQPKLYKNGAAFKKSSEQSCEIKGGSHEIAAMMRMINNSYTGTMWSLKFINLKAWAVAHERSEGATKGLRVYKFHRLHIVPV